MFERFTRPARRAVATASQEAADLGDARVGAEHLLIGITVEPEDVGGRVLAGLGVTPAGVRQAVTALRPTDAEALAAFGIDLDAVSRRVEDAFGRGAWERSRARARLVARRRSAVRFGAPAKEALGGALREATAQGSGVIDTGHLLVAVVEAGGPAGTVLGRLGVATDAATIRALARAEARRVA